jgi:hypothetical protein
VVVVVLEAYWQEQQVLLLAQLTPSQLVQEHLAHLAHHKEQAVLIQL